MCTQRESIFHQPLFLLLVHYWYSRFLRFGSTLCYSCFPNREERAKDSCRPIMYIGLIWLLDMALRFRTKDHKITWVNWLPYSADSSIHYASLRGGTRNGITMRAICSHWHFLLLNLFLNNLLLLGSIQIKTFCIQCEGGMRFNL